MDSISKWTSSVLAELESIDLNLTDTEDRLSGGEAQPSVTPTSASFANTIGLFESERRWPGAVATSQTSRRGSSVPPKRSEERRDEKSPEDINEVPMEAKLTLEKALEDLRHIETFSREVAGRGRTGQRTKPSAFPTNKTSVLTHSPLAKPVMLNCQSNTWPTPISAGQEVSEPMSDREVSYKSLVETSQQQPTVAIQILTESNAVLKLGDSDMVETPLASPTDAHSVGGATPVPSEAYQADDETRDDLNSPSPRPTYFQTRKKADETSNSAKEVPAVPHDPMSKGRVESWMQESAAKSPPKPAPRTSIKASEFLIAL